MNKTKTFVLLLIALSFWIGLSLYSQAPELMASHWNYRGEVDGYLPKFWGLFMLPIVSLALFALFLVIPKIDPKKDNVEKFGGYFDGFILIFELLFFFLYLLTIFWSRGIEFNMAGYMAPAMGVLFYYCGIMIENAKPNWFIGIRTPWTLSSEKVWNETHKIGGKLYKEAGLISVLGAFAGDYALIFVVGPILIVSIYLTVFSYREYAKEKKVRA